jgi:hypothetical protein
MLLSKRPIFLNGILDVCVWYKFLYTYDVPVPQMMQQWLFSLSCAAMV